MTLSESYRFCRFWFYATKLNLISNGFSMIVQAFVSFVELKFGVQIVFFDTICENFMSQRLKVFNFLRLSFNCFRILFTSSHRLLNQMFSWVGRCKIWFLMRICERTTCTERTLSSPAIKVGLFSNVVFVYEHFLRFFNEIFCQVRRTKTVFRSEYGKEELLFQKIVFDFAQWPFNCFSICYFVTLRTSIKISIGLQKCTYRFPSDFAKVHFFSKSSFVFRLARWTLFSSKCGLQIAKLSSFFVSWARRCKTIVFGLNSRTDDFVRKLFPSRQSATNAYFFSIMLCGLSRTFTLIVERKSEM